MGGSKSRICTFMMERLLNLHLASPRLEAGSILKSSKSSADR